MIINQKPTTVVIDDFWITLIDQSLESAVKNQNNPELFFSYIENVKNFFDRLSNGQEFIEKTKDTLKFQYDENTTFDLSSYHTYTGLICYYVMVHDKETYCIYHSNSLCFFYHLDEDGDCIHKISVMK